MEIFGREVEVAKYNAISVYTEDGSYSVVGDITKEDVDTLLIYIENSRGTIDKVQGYSLDSEDNIEIINRAKEKYKTDKKVLIGVINSSDTRTICNRLAYQWRIDEILHIHKGRRPMIDVVVLGNHTVVCKEGNRVTILSRDVSEGYGVRKFIGGINNGIEVLS